MKAEEPATHRRQPASNLSASRGDCCVFKYDATIALHGSLLGWLFGVLFIRPMFRSLMQEHLIEMKATIEARASRSRVYPQRPCPPAEALSEIPEKAGTA